MIPMSQRDLDNLARFAGYLHEVESIARQNPVTQMQVDRIRAEFKSMLDNFRCLHPTDSNFRADP